MLRLVAGEPRRQVLVGGHRAALTEESREDRPVQREVDRAAQLRVVLEERPLRVQRQVGDDRLRDDEQVLAVALELLGERRERRRRHDAVVDLTPLELQPDLRRERTEAIEDRAARARDGAVVVAVSLEQDGTSVGVVRDRERAGRRQVVALHVRRVDRNGAEVRQREALLEVRRGTAQADRQRAPASAPARDLAQVRRRRRRELGRDCTFERMRERRGRHRGAVAEPPAGTNRERVCEPVPQTRAAATLRPRE